MCTTELCISVLVRETEREDKRETTERTRRGRVERENESRGAGVATGSLLLSAGLDTLAPASTLHSTLTKL